MYNRGMMPPKEWLKPPRSLLVILFLVTLVSVSALAWFGSKLLDQERVVEAQRAQDRLEQAAGRIAATARGALAEAGERLGSWLIAPPSDGKPEDGVLLILSGHNPADTPGQRDFSALPANRLLYRPFPSPEPDELLDAFAEGEALEFQQLQPGPALEWYQRLADSENPALKAGALMRMARVFRKTGQTEQARAAYLRLAAVGSEARVAGVPAELAALHGICEISGNKSDAIALQADLLRARWPLTRGQFEFYWSEALRLSGNDAKVPEELSSLSDAVAQWWRESSHESNLRVENQRGQTTVWADEHPWFVIWRGIPGRRAVLLIRPESLLKSIFTAGDVSCAAVDSEGRIVAGRRNGTSHPAVLTPAETRLPWTLYLTSAQGYTETGMLARRRFLLLVTTVMVVFLIAGAYFIAHAIRSDLAVARMQSDFVSAVSHEFRSPLTSIRQLSEILALDRIPNEARRHVYYETLVRETVRLQRLVEALLNFGRMEAGVRQYRFEALDTGTLVSRVAAEFETQIAGSGRRIELDGCNPPCTVDADPEALSVALRNLVDNALKYAPECPVVRVQWGVEKTHVAISVHDRGPGIPASEKRAIFRKFVRGSTAEAANVKGSGVGLAMVRHIVAAHGGNVSLASEAGAGSVFTILLPLGKERK
jgi:signal transduction histidine kinase